MTTTTSEVARRRTARRSAGRSGAAVIRPGFAWAVPATLFFVLFAVVPLRNFLPGSPPAGSWIDQAVVQWVLIGLGTAMTLYIIAWVRQGD